MFCHRCGAENQPRARFRQKWGNAIYIEASHAPKGAWASSADGPIWNPNATANWSLIFTPAFGSYLQMLNWKTLGEEARAKSSQQWFYVSLAMLAVILLMSFVSPDENAASGLGLLFLITWHFASAKSQSTYVKAKFGTEYPRRPWGKALLYGLGAILALFSIVYARLG